MRVEKVVIAQIEQCVATIDRELAKHAAARFDFKAAGDSAAVSDGLGFLLGQISPSLDIPVGRCSG